MSEDAAVRGVREEVNLLPAASSTALSSVLAEKIVAARDYRSRARSANTIRAYSSDWRQFEAWCDARNLEPLPALAEAVATYLAALARAGRADSTVTRHLAAIGCTTARPGTCRQPTAAQAWSSPTRSPGSGANSARGPAPKK